MIEITDAERRRWQREAVAVLGKILEHGVSEHLPVITWQVAGAGCGVAGKCAGYPMAGRAEAFRAWRDGLARLAGEPDTERSNTDRDPARYVARWESYERVNVTLLADIFSDIPSE